MKKEVKMSVKKTVAVDEAAASASIVESVILKSLFIDLSGPKHNYVFTGDWNGNDVRLVLNHLYREYRLYNRAKRRGVTTTR